MAATVGTLKTLKAFRRYLNGEITLAEFQEAEVGYEVVEIDLERSTNKTRDKMPVKVIR
jgi:hypothetical protein